MSVNLKQYCLEITACLALQVLMKTLSFSFMSPPSPPIPAFSPSPCLLSLSLLLVFNDQGAIALCEMVEFYGCTSKLNLAHNHRLRPRAWLTIGRTLKKVHTSMASQLCLHTCIRWCVCACVCVHACVYVYVRACMYVYVCMCVYTLAPDT